MDQVTTSWRKSSYSATGANCVEAGHVPGTVLVRDTTNRNQGTLSFAPRAWADFTARLRG